MDTALSIIILCEFLVTLFVIWGFLHEQSFVRFEQKLYRKLKQTVKALMRM